MLLPILLALQAAVGDKVPDFSLRDTSGKDWSLAELRKRADSGVVSLTFWCTFCHSCRELDASFQKAAADRRGKAALLALDSSAVDSPEKIEDFRRSRKFDVPVFVDADGKLADLFGVKVTTTTVLLDKDGVLRYRGRFGPAQDALQALLDGKDIAVKETPPAG